MNRTIAFIVARLGSTRLPRKALLPMAGKPMIERLLDRVRRARLLDEVALATTTLPEDAELSEFAKAQGIRCFRGSPDNVSLRMSQAAEALGAGTIVELLGDNPLIHSELIDAVVSVRRERGSDYAASISKEYRHIHEVRRFPIGIRVQVYQAAAAKRWSEFPEFLSRDLGTTAFMFMNHRLFRCDYLQADGPWAPVHEPEMNFAVNYRRNFDLVERMFSDLLPGDENFSLPKAAEWIRARPEAVAAMGNQ